MYCIFPLQKSKVGDLIKSITIHWQRGIFCETFPVKTEVESEVS